ncbi:IQ domain-containing protein M [Myotis lucifugus]|uniref:IQ domain-containing protein M n=1 Tax=Myotis lucifugus TaxID=59463 RepID=UPI000CCC87B1|nr:IQ domain-containing protein M [Myotis lucifugus]
MAQNPLNLGPLFYIDNAEKRRMTNDKLSILKTSQCALGAQPSKRSAALSTMADAEAMPVIGENQNRCCSTLNDNEGSGLLTWSQGVNTPSVDPSQDPGTVLEISKQDFFEEAKTLIAQHYENINENKVQGTSINVFRNKQQKPKPGKYIPAKIKNKEIFDVVQELQIAHKRPYFHKDVSKGECFEEPPQRTSFKEPHMFHGKEKTKGYVDLIAKANGCSPGSPKDVPKCWCRFQQVLITASCGCRQGLPGGGQLKSQTATPSWVQADDTESGPVRDKDFVTHGTACRLSCMSLSLPFAPSPMGLRGEVLIDAVLVNVVDCAFLSVSIEALLVQQVQLGKIVTNIESVGKKMEKEKQEYHGKPRAPSSLSKVSKFDSKVKRIGPHIEIFQVFRERARSIITKKTIRMVTVVQAFVRGWLERRRYRRLLNKALYHGPTLRAVINMYRRQIHRVKHRLCLWRTRQIINYAELEEWMDRKKYYETMFAKRQDWHGLERSELLKFFNDCGHYPTVKQIDQVWDLVHRGK